MNILRNGNLEKLKKTKYFLCTNCGCIWQADKDEYEYEIDQQYNEEYYTCQCPFESCGATGRCISESQVEEELG